jgi:hypothetical protein
VVVVKNLGNMVVPMLEAQQLVVPVDIYKSTC